jgi:hypothetical protein
MVPAVGLFRIELRNLADIATTKDGLSAALRTMRLTK